MMSAPLPQAGQTGHLGERLTRIGLVSADQLQIALLEQKRSGGLLGATLVRLGFLDENKLAAVLAERAGLSSIDLKHTLLDHSLIRKWPKSAALRCRAIPVRLDKNLLEIAMADPYDIVAMDEIRRHFPRDVTLVPRVAAAADIAETLANYDDTRATLETILREIEDMPPAAPTEQENWQHPIVRLADTILSDAVRQGASDIHLEPESSFVRLRYRIDGALHQIRALHLAHWPELSHRIKIMAGMNIADQRSLQDGRFTMDVGGAAIDFRAAVMPTVQGENIVIRILDHRRALLPLDRLGYGETTQTELARLLERPEGIMLVTGPTGCGKTTTLYSILTSLSAVDVNVMTLEDPVEYRFELIRQTCVQEQQGLGFADGVRGILRQDPDIIFIGEVRDSDTAHMALRAAMTGHRVFSTLHCTDAFGAIPRLVDLGLQPRMLAGHVGGVVAQRLVRRLCPHCKTHRQPTEEEKNLLRNLAAAKSKPPSPPLRLISGGFAEAQAAFDAPETKGETESETPALICDEILIGQTVGCEDCLGTGYRGRVALAEVLRVTPELDEMIASDAPREAMRKTMLRQGFRSMAEDGLAKLRAGDIDLASLRRAVDLTREM
ncbi:MAG: GspE/PulE family protein [Bdellovibrionales bacterium]